MKIRVKRGTRAQLNTAASAGQLLAGEPYLITDEGRIALGLSASTYEVYAKTSEISGALAVTTKTAAYSATTADQVILCSGTFTVDLYNATGNDGRVLHIKNTGTGVITIDAQGSQTIDGALTVVMSMQYTCLSIVCDGANWQIL